MERIAVLGSTGSIGVNTLSVISALKDKFTVIGLSADSNIRLLADQARAFRPRIVCVGDEELRKRIKGVLSPKTRIVFGVDGLSQIVSRGDVDSVVFATRTSSCLVPIKIGRASCRERV